MKLGEKLFLICLVLTVVCVLVLIPPRPDSKEWLANPSPVDWSRVEDDPDQTLSLQWQGIISYSTAKAGSWIEQNLEKRFNLEIDPLFMDVNTYSRRRPLMLVGGDIPDVMWSGDPLAVRANIRNGFIMELPYEVILEHAPTYVEMINRYGPQAWLYSQYRGRNYGLPTVISTATGPRVSAWRMDWLRNVGIDSVPETVEEMHEALHRFRYQDPDGNGKQDTYGWYPDIGHWSLMFTELFAAYGVLPFEFMEREGQLVWGGLLPETREVLEILRDWYAEGLLDPDFVTDSQGRYPEARFISGKVGYLHPADHPSTFYAQEPTSLSGKTLAFHPDAQVVPAAALRSAEGPRLGRSWGGAAHILQFGRHLEQQPEKVVRVLRMLEDISKSQTLYLEARHGQRGIHWEYYPETVTLPDGSIQRAGIGLVPPYSNPDRTRINRTEMIGEPCLFFYPNILEEEFEAEFVSENVRSWYSRYAHPDWSIVSPLGKADVVPSSGRYLKDLILFQKIFFIEIIIGERPLEDFDGFVAEWRRRGGDTLLREANQMFDQLHEIYDRVGVPEATR